MATRNKRKLAALNKENCEEHPRGNITQNSAAPRSQEDYITQVSEEIEGRVTKKLSQEFSRTENCILGALARLDDFLMNPLLQGHSGNTPETSGNASKTNQGTNEDDPQSDPHPEASIFSSQTIRNSGQETCCDMVTGVTDQTRSQHDMPTGSHEEVMYCSPGTSSGKQKKNRSTSQPQFRSKNIPATIEADQILLALQQLANDSNSANFQNNKAEFPNCQSHLRQ